MTNEQVYGLIALIIFFAGYFIGSIIEGMKSALRERKEFLEYRKQMEKRNTK